MKYTHALSVSAKAATYLQDNQGRISMAEAAVHVSALGLALEAIANHNYVELTPRLDHPEPN